MKVRRLIKIPSRARPIGESNLLNFGTNEYICALYVEPGQNTAKRRKVCEYIEETLQKMAEEQPPRGANAYFLGEKVEKPVWVERPRVVQVVP
ncbi:hypothetical protein HYZ97_00785 [Candidatus Pacearchaeota archaeon]|nr:hypothetical protein [Candidatus Pacearchaeota archaeon]